jgi:hypothetical protein
MLSFTARFQKAMRHLVDGDPKDPLAPHNAY